MVSVVVGSQAGRGTGMDCKGPGRMEVGGLLADSIEAASGNTEADSNSAGHIAEGIHMLPAG